MKLLENKEGHIIGVVYKEKKTGDIKVKQTSIFPTHNYTCTHPHMHTRTASDDQSGPDSSGRRVLLKVQKRPGQLVSGGSLSLCRADTRQLSPVQDRVCGDCSSPGWIWAHPGLPDIQYLHTSTGGYQRKDAFRCQRVHEGGCLSRTARFVSY